MLEAGDWYLHQAAASPLHLTCTC